jgi:hypothetical protein
LNAAPPSAARGAWERLALPAIEGGGRRTAVLFLFGVAVLCAIQLVVGWKIAGQVNHDTDAFDQGSYILMAETMRGSWIPWYSDGTRNPLLPWIAGNVLDPAAPDFFQRAKRLNVVLGVLGTAVLAAVFRRRLGPLAAWNASALAALALLLPASTFFGAEVLFYMLFFLVVVVCLNLLVRNPPGRYVLLAFLAGLAALAKPSVSPLVALFFGWSLLKALYARGDGWSARRLALGAGIFLVGYGGMLAPRAGHAWQTYGSPFYSLPAFWFWADDWSSCVEKYADCRPGKIAAMPVGERPTVGGYFHRHSVSDAVARVTDGFGVRLRQFLHPELKWSWPFDKPGRLKRVVLPHRGFYLVGLGLVLVAMGVFAWRSGGFGGRLLIPAGFFLSVWVLYALAAGWYLPIGPGHRFILVLYLPTLWALSTAAERLRARAGSWAANPLFLAAHLAIFGLLASRLGILLVDGNFKKVSFTF